LAGRNIEVHRLDAGWQRAEIHFLHGSQIRAIDETDYVKPTFSELLAVRGENSFYHNNAIQPWRIDAQGQLTNANA
jgi:hypothetical protein